VLDQLSTIEQVVIAFVRRPNLCSDHGPRGEGADKGLPPQEPPAERQLIPERCRSFELEGGGRHSKLVLQPLKEPIVETLEEPLGRRGTRRLSSQPSAVPLRDSELLVKDDRHPLRVELVREGPVRFARLRIVGDAKCWRCAIERHLQVYLPGELVLPAVVRGAMSLDEAFLQEQRLELSVRRQPGHGSSRRHEHSLAPGSRRGACFPAEAFSHVLGHAAPEVQRLADVKGKAVRVTEHVDARASGQERRFLDG